MKKIFTLFAVALMGVSAVSAQTKAELIAKRTEVQSQLDKIKDDGIAKKFEIRLDAQYVNNFKGGLGFTKEDGNGITKSEEGGLINFGLGYNFNSNWYLGLASGYVHNMIGSVNQSIPLLLDLTYRWNTKNQKWSVFGEARGGYMWSVTKAADMIPYHMNGFPNALMLEPQVGAYYRITPKIDLKLALGYMFYDPEKEGFGVDLSNRNYGFFKIGFNFRMGGDGTAKLKAQLAEYDRLIAAYKEPKPKEEVWTTVVDTTWYDEVTYEDDIRERDIDKRIFFTIRESEVGTTDEQIAAVAEFLKTVQNGEVTITSYADKGTGNAKLNLGYSKQRADKTRRALIEKGVDPKMIKKTEWKGDAVQPYPGENDKNRVSIITGHGVYNVPKKIVTKKFKTSERRVRVQ
ncbi:MAG: OmpA family protein [Bacteroidales bacterium]|nr:OmpA family protein [Candidatus Physcousia equi]